MNDEPTPIERGVPHSIRRRTRLVAVIVIFQTVVLIAALSVAGLALGRLSAVNDTTHRLDQANAEQRRQSAGNTLAFAVILEDLAAAFDTPPAPDPSRVVAVQGLCSTASAFRRSVGAPAATASPCGPTGR